MKITRKKYLKCPSFEHCIFRDLYPFCDGTYVYECISA